MHKLTEVSVSMSHFVLKNYDSKGFFQLEVNEMVFYFTSNVVQPEATIFMGIDKHENEELIRWGWPEDVWFHVDKVNKNFRRNIFRFFY